MYRYLQALLLATSTTQFMQAILNISEFITRINYFTIKLFHNTNHLPTSAVQSKKAVCANIKHSRYFY